MNISYFIVYGLEKSIQGDHVVNNMRRMQTSWSMGTNILRIPYLYLFDY